MKISVFSAQPYDKQYLSNAFKANHRTQDFALHFHPFPLSPETAALANASDAVCVFVNDPLTSEILETLYRFGVRAVLLRCAGFNNVDMETAKKLGLFVTRVSAYSPEAVAEFAVSLIMTLNRRTHRAYTRVREGNFSLNGLLGFTMHGKTVGIIGTGKIGLATARILKGFGCRLLAYDPYHVPQFAELGEYVELDELLPQADIISLHCPLMESTRYLINAATLNLMKPDAMLVNTSRGGLIDTSAVIAALKSRKLGSLALDVYEEESALFYHDRSADIIVDDIFQRLMTFPNVIVTGHQGFFTDEALTEIANVTVQNMLNFVDGMEDNNTVFVGKKV